MQPEVDKLLVDMLMAAENVAHFIEFADFETYSNDILLRSAVERQLFIVGEAMARLARLDSDAASKIEDFRLIIGFRNILAHGYDVIDDETTWSIAHDELPNLVAQILRMRES